MLSSCLRAGWARALLLAVAMFLALAPQASLAGGGGGGGGSDDFMKKFFPEKKEAPRSERSQPRSKSTAESKPRATPVDRERVTVRTATRQATADIEQCEANYTGRPLYDCIAQVLDNLANRVATTPLAVPTAVTTSLRTAATELRAATTKEAAISAIAKAKAVLTSALAEVKVVVSASVKQNQPTAGDKAALEMIGSVLDRAALALQRKG